jgi:1-acyl-sn-glycerol-3-phosphate acyltransferase
MGVVKSLAGITAATGMLVPAYYATRMMSAPAARRVPVLFHRAISHAMGVRSQRHGEVADGAVLYVANHLSWLDIPVLGGHLDGSFVAKAEVGVMPLVGSLANIQNTIYVDRSQRHRAGDQANGIRERLRDGGNVILFPEGTSNNGVHILPFKSSLFSVAEGEGVEHVRIQPITIAYTHLNGLPLTRNRLMELAWIGDMELAPHAIDVMGLGRVMAHVQCHAPVRRSDFPDRKALARHCREEIAEGYHRLIRGAA